MPNTRAPAGTYNLAFGAADDVPTGIPITALDAPIVGHTWAECRDDTNYHMQDYPLFHMNIRNNSLLRVQRFPERGK